MQFDTVGCFYVGSLTVYVMINYNRAFEGTVRSVVTIPFLTETIVLYNKKYKFDEISNRYYFS